MKKLLPVLFALLLPSFYSNASKISPPCYKSSQSLVPPHFPGGEDAFRIYLDKNLNWPKTDTTNFRGVVLISFFVEKDGQLTNFKVEKSMGAKFDKEALRVLTSSPKWVPAKRDGKFIRSKYSVPLQYSVSVAS